MPVFLQGIGWCPLGAAASASSSSTSAPSLPQRSCGGEGAVRRRGQWGEALAVPDFRCRARRSLGRTAWVSRLLRAAWAWSSRVARRAWGAGTGRGSGSKGHAAARDAPLRWRGLRSADGLEGLAVLVAEAGVLGEGNHRDGRRLPWRRDGSPQGPRAAGIRPRQVPIRNGQRVILSVSPGFRRSCRLIDGPRMTLKVTPSGRPMTSRLSADGSPLCLRALKRGAHTEASSSS